MQTTHLSILFSPQRSENYHLDFTRYRLDQQFGCKWAKINFLISIFFSHIIRNRYIAPYRFIRWLREDVLIADSSHPEKIPPPRVTLFNNGSLQVKNVRRNDTAEYLCEVMTDETGLESQLHAIEVQCKCVYCSITNFREIFIRLPSIPNRSTASNDTAEWKDWSETRHCIRDRMRSNWNTATDNHLAIERKLRSFGTKFSSSLDRGAQPRYGRSSWVRCNKWGRSSSCCWHRYGGSMWVKH